MSRTLTACFANSRSIQASDADDVLEQVASAFFSEENPTLAQCIQLAQIGAKLGAKWERLSNSLLEIES